jgi:nucleoside-triphosphatase
MILLLTGSPGIGMTTVIRKAAERLSSVAGFYTSEIRVGGVRQGFRLTTFDGRDFVFAHRELESPVRITGYGIDVGALDALTFGDARVYLIDEIGKMELTSAKLEREIRRILDSGRRVVATVSLKGEGLVDEVKRRSDATVWKVTRETRDGLPERVLAWLGPDR